MNTSDPSQTRMRSPRKGSAFRHGVSRNAGDEKPKPPTMVRSRTQVATAYAPGRLFTWEGGRGICLAVPLADPVRPNQMQKTMIKEGIDEFIQNWAGRAQNCRPFGKPIYIEQCLDSKILEPQPPNSNRSRKFVRVHKAIQDGVRTLSSFIPMHEMRPSKKLSLCGGAGFRSPSDSL